MNNPAPRLCIGLPVFNGENYLEEALDSLLGQTYSDYELIILDNASTDETQDIGQAYAARDQRIRYHRNQVNIGAARNWYLALALCSSEYFKWAAHDDMYAPEFLEQCVAVLDQDPSVVLSYTKTRVIDEHGTSVRNLDVEVDTTSSKPHLRLYNMIGIDYLCIQMYGVMRTNALRKTRVYTGYVGWDRNTLAELCLLGRICEVPEYLFLHRLYPLAWGAVVTSKKSQQVLSVYDPTINWRFDLSAVYRFRNYFAAVNRAPLSPSERLMCYAELVRLIAEKSANRIKVRGKPRRDGADRTTA